MNKASEYSDRIISRLSSDLSSELFISINDMLQGEESVDLGITVGRSTIFQTATVYYDGDSDTIETIEIYEEYWDEDGCKYSGTRELSELNLNELIKVWEAVKDLAEKD